MTEIVTSAPEAYDGFGAATVEWMPYVSRPGQTNRYRVVSIPDEHADWQRGRYASGLYPRLTRADFAEWVQLGLVVPA